MWPTAKIARAMVGEPPESSSTFRFTSAAASKYSHHRPAGEDHRRDQRRPLGGRLRGRLPGLHQDLAEEDDQEQPEPLREVVGIQRLGRVRGRQRLQIVLAARAAGRRAILDERRAGLDADRQRPQRVPERLRSDDRQREQRGRRQKRALDPSLAAERRAPRPARAAWRPARPRRRRCRPPTPARSRPRRRRWARCRRGTAADGPAGRRRSGCRGRRSRPTSTTGRRTVPARSTRCASRAPPPSGARAARRRARTRGRGTARPTKRAFQTYQSR